MMNDDNKDAIVFFQFFSLNGSDEKREMGFIKLIDCHTCIVQYYSLRNGARSLQLDFSDGIFEN